MSTGPRAWPRPAPALWWVPPEGPACNKLRGAWCPRFRIWDGVLGGLTQTQYLLLDCQTVIWGPLGLWIWKMWSFLRDGCVGASCHPGLVSGLPPPGVQ